MAPIITNGNFDAVTAFTPIAVTGEADTEVFSAVAHGLLDGQEVRLYGLSGGTGIAAGIFYVINKADDSFQLSATRAGSAAAFSTDITAGYVVRTGSGVPTGWTITKAGSSELIAGNDPSKSPSDLPICGYAEMRVDSSGNAVAAHEHLTLSPSTRYHLTLESYWLHEDPAEVSPAHAPVISLVEDGAGHSLLSTGLWQSDGNATINIPVPEARGGRLSIVFTTPATHTAYTLTISRGTLAGTTGYCEVVRISKIKLEPCPLNLPTERPENNDTVRAALPENS